MPHVADHSVDAPILRHGGVYERLQVADLENGTTSTDTSKLGSEIDAAFGRRHQRNLVAGLRHLPRATRANALTGPCHERHSNIWHDSLQSVFSFAESTVNHLRPNGRRLPFTVVHSPNMTATETDIDIGLTVSVFCIGISICTLQSCHLTPACWRHALDRFVRQQSPIPQLLACHSDHSTSKRNHRFSSATHICAAEPCTRALSCSRQLPPFLARPTIRYGPSLRKCTLPNELCR